jgi:AcrR family transcriptional regulator
VPQRAEAAARNPACFHFVSLACDDSEPLSALRAVRLERWLVVKRNDLKDMKEASASSSPGRSIKQQRSHKTYNALIATGFKLLEQRELDEIGIAELAKAAGYSVGAFYARFRSKDEFFDAMVVRHMEQRTKDRNRLFAKASDENLIDLYIRDLVRYYWKRRRFWRAAMIRSIRSPGFWEPLRLHGHALAQLLIDRMSKQAGRPLSAVEQTNVRFAFQIAFGTINNAIINRPGPIMIGQALFVANLARAFRLVADYDRIIGLKRRR